MAPAATAATSAAAVAAVIMGAPNAQMLSQLTLCPSLGQLSAAALA
jgi:hypothetical protein